MLTLLIINIVGFGLFVGHVVALGIGPTHLEVTLPPGSSAHKSVQVLNSEKRAIHVMMRVTDDVADFITLSPWEFDLPPAPNGRSYRFVDVYIDVPIDAEEGIYKGDIEAMSGMTIVACHVTITVYSPPPVPEFPIGLALEILFIPVIIYMWRSKQRKIN